MELFALAGIRIPTETLSGKVLLVVNVASYCGHTPQYEGLQALYESRRHRGFLVIGIPCNQFGNQEPGSAVDIERFCSLEFGVTFPLLCKQNVNPPDRSELYASLVASPVGGGKDVKWNFEKFLVGRSGDVVARFGSDISPDADELVAAIDAALGG